MSRNSVDSILLGDSDVMVRLRDSVVRLAPCGIPVLIQGETGAGKELVARALHDLSGRKGRFVAVNVCAIPDAMFEDAVFGHVRGAFTGALGDHAGFLEEGRSGSVFMDEIGSLSMEAQGKLLRAVELGEFRPVGAKADRRSDFRLIAATNVDVWELVARGRFRADLGHRIAAAVLRVPPLREHLEDLPLLVEHFAARASVALARRAVVTPGAIEELGIHPWPGNVRELRHVVEVAIALAGGGSIGREEIRSSFTCARTREEQSAHSLPRRRLLALLEACAWDTRQVSHKLGIHRATVYRRMRALGIALTGSAQRGNVGSAEADAPTSSRPFLGVRWESDVSESSRAP